MTSPNDAPESLECNYSSTVLQHRVMTNNPTGLSFQQKINQENVVQSSHSSCDGNSCMITKINRSSTDVFDDNNAEGISAFGASSNMKPSFSYVDKSVMECQMSKTIVCDQEVNVNDVKDICIDDGVASLENFFFKSTAEKSISKISPLEEDRNEGSIKEKETSSEVSKFIADDRKVSLEDHFAMDWTTHNDAKDLTQIEEEKLNLSEPELLMQKLVKRSYSSESLDKIGLQISGEKTNLEDPSSASKSVDSCNDTPALDSAAEPPKDNIPAHPSGYNDEFENGSIALTFNSISPVANGGEERQECCGRSDSVIGTQVLTNLEYRTSDSRLLSSQNMHDIGESSFSAVDPLASLVTYSGPVAYSGSISLRSESSTTSTRSFAFPILQSEWNSSPVKMVKAERRHYRKYRGWREGLLCCKF
uniref:18S pre-ribosomal assembly protein gar2-related n=2 Tax=Cucumis sativus TaxID=3659 RepID=A0A0A0KFP8_CUCSA